MKPEDIIVKQSTSNGVTTIDITVRGKVVNMSSTNMYSSQVSAYADKLNNISVFNGDAGQIGGSDNKQRVNVRVSFEFEAVSSLDQVDDSDHVVAIVDDVTAKSENGNAVGQAQIGGHVAAVEVGHLKDNSGAHELGHNLGLEHVKHASRLMHPQGVGNSAVGMGERRNLAGSHIGPGDGTRNIGNSNGDNVTTLTARKDIIKFLNDNRIRYDKSKAQ